MPWADKQHDLRAPPRHHRARRAAHDPQQPVALLVADLAQLHPGCQVRPLAPSHLGARIDSDRREPCYVNPANVAGYSTSSPWSRPSRWGQPVGVAARRRRREGSLGTWVFRRTLMHGTPDQADGRRRSSAAAPVGPCCRSSDGLRAAGIIIRVSGVRVPPPASEAPRSRPPTSAGRHERIGPDGAPALKIAAPAVDVIPGTASLMAAISRRAPASSTCMTWLACRASLRPFRRYVLICRGRCPATS